MFVASTALSWAAPPQMAFLPADEGAPEVFPVAEISTISFADGKVNVMKSYNHMVSYTPGQLSKIVFDSDGLYSSVDGVTEGKKATVTPNPVSDYFSIEVDGATPLTVYTITGSRVIYVPDYRGTQINASALAPGIYIVKTRSLTAKFIKL